MTNKIFIVGTGLFAQVAKDYFNEYSNYEVVGFSSHREYIVEDSMSGLPIVAIEDLDKVWPKENYHSFVAVGYKNMNKVRQKIYQEIKSKEYFCASFIHPAIKIWDTTFIGDNVFIFEDNTIQPYTTIGSNTVLWSGNHVGHHSVIGENCFISSHVVISGSCIVKDNAFIGVNATLRDGITIEKENLIGAGAIIMKSTKEKEIYAPLPTKLFSKNSEEIGF